MDRLIHLVAPRTWLGLIVKSVLMQALICALFVLQQQVTQGPPIEGWWPSLVDVIVVGLPFVALLLALIGRLDRMQAQLAVLATTDLLTGLPNRRAFFERGIGLGDRGKVVFMVDVDHFKKINDRFGHAAGDRCLVAVADRLRQLSDEGHLVSRIGGEEFAVVLTDVTRDQALEIGDRLAEGLKVAPDGESAEEIPLTFSVGASCRRTSPSLDEALHRADTALYYAKRAGRAQLQFWRPLGSDDTVPDITRNPPVLRPDPTETPPGPGPASRSVAA